MAQRMRMNVSRKSPAQRRRLYDAPHTPRRQPASPPHLRVHQKRPIQHQPALPGLSESLLTPWQILPDSLCRLISQRHQPFLLALAPHQNRIIAPLDRSHIQPTQLAVTNPATIQQLKDRPIPLRPRSTFIHRIQNPVDLLNTRHSRQVQRPLGRTHQQRWILPNLPFLRQPFEPASDRCQRPRRTRLPQPPLVQHAQVSPNVQMFHIRDPPSLHLIA